MATVQECHQFLVLQEEQNRIVFEPIKDRIISIVVNDFYGTRIQIPESNKFQGFTGFHDSYKHEMCKYLRDNLRIVSAGVSINKIGKFCRMNFFIEGTEYKISDIQYVL